MVQRKRIKLASFKNCTGCMSCLSSCPRNAITTKLRFGFYYPQIDKKKCIKCGLCIKSCPTLVNNIVQNEIKTIYSAQANKIEWRLKCSSGGIFGLLSNFALKNNWIVYGASYNKNEKQVNHFSSDEEELSKFYGSKYVQCTGNNKFSQIKHELQQGRMVLYSGCPCEIAGLLSFLGRKYDNLLTIDFICHGVPSPIFLSKVIENESKNKTVSLVTFREKNDSFPSLSTSFYFEDGTRTVYKSLDYYYFRLFHDNICLRRSCYNCSVQSMHFSDITLGDDWEASDKNNMGKSLVFINTDKGDSAFKNVIELCNKNISMKNASSLPRHLFKHKYSKAGYHLFCLFRLYNHPRLAKLFFNMYKPIQKLKGKMIEIAVLLKNKVSKKQ